MIRLRVFPGSLYRAALQSLRLSSVLGSGTRRSIAQGPLFRVFSSRREHFRSMETRVSSHRQPLVSSSVTLPASANLVDISFAFFLSKRFDRRDAFENSHKGKRADVKRERVKQLALQGYNDAAEFIRRVRAADTTADRRNIH